MSPKDRSGLTRSSGNVFRDLGLIQLQRVITSRHLKQAEAATILRVTQPRVSHLLRGRIDLFSTDALIDMLARLGIRVRLVLKPSRRRVKVA